MLIFSILDQISREIHWNIKLKIESSIVTSYGCSLKELFVFLFYKY